jgi:hypothetical protein
MARNLGYVSLPSRPSPTPARPRRAPASGHLAPGPVGLPATGAPPAPPAPSTPASLTPCPGRALCRGPGAERSSATGPPLLRAPGSRTSPPSMAIPRLGFSRRPGRPPPRAGDMREASPDPIRDRIHQGSPPRALLLVRLRHRGTVPADVIEAPAACCGTCHVIERRPGPPGRRPRRARPAVRRRAPAPSPAPSMPGDVAGGGAGSPTRRRRVDASTPRASRASLP